MKEERKKFLYKLHVYTEEVWTIVSSIAAMEKLIDRPLQFKGKLPLQF